MQVVYRNRIWILGGWDGSVIYNDVWYSNDGIHWREADGVVPWGPRDWHSSFVFNDKIWIIGALTYTHGGSDV